MKKWLEDFAKDFEIWPEEESDTSMSEVGDEEEDEEGSSEDDDDSGVFHLAVTMFNIVQFI
ncbi:hypothetical protein Patl1_22782 [Pistacia atlantica]|uniref:Uncharacterized protein n=1 Tax=Pistacia atlantica TaxID=434234 RepID=A0ACC1A0Z5_9ROSI|nr:hypothetical protein Patl1_22782 [Pistacia atlantica]